MSISAGATSDHDGGPDAAPPLMRQCGRCREFSPAPADLHPAALLDWWACNACHEALIPHQGRG
jgi:hypothetical protein